MMLDATEQLDFVRTVIKEKIGKFTKSEIMELVPSVGKASVENSLKKLTEEGVIEKHRGCGRSKKLVTPPGFEEVEKFMMNLVNF